MRTLEPDGKNQLQTLFYALDAEVAAAGPRCEASGRCCRFTEYGHTLFLSEMEAELLFEPGIPAGRAINRDTCPFQVEGLCTARDRRPMGCRVYFCDPTFAEKQVELSEKYVRRLKELHEEHGRPWRYAPLHVFAEEVPTTHAGELAPGTPVDVVELT
jgi:Fe-S-cluster containining protein